jgi:hypothetical protein
LFLDDAQTLIGKINITSEQDNFLVLGEELVEDDFKI